MRIWLAPVLMLAVAFLVAWLVRGYPWQLALVVGLAIGSLCYTVIRVGEHLLPLLRSPAESAPGKGDEGAEQQ